MKANEIILLIEDDEEKAEIIKSILKKHLNGEIRHIGDGQAALDFLYSEEGRYTRLILLDLVLPSVDGVEILKRIKADPLKSQVAVIILTSSSQTQAYIDSLGLHPDGYVNKPSRLKNCA